MPRINPFLQICPAYVACSIAPPSVPTNMPRAQKKHGPQALGRSRGGFGTKIHSIVDALGNPIGFTLTGSEQADIRQATQLLEHAPSAEAVIADKAYDSDALVQHIEAAGAESIIPPRSNRTSPRTYDQHRYKARNLVERFFNRLNQFRRIATR
ncbi:MAG: IS5 family transposase [Nitrococcus sp.]|nr:IS5 family transposase [Nitrococcus sp.]